MISTTLKLLDGVFYSIPMHTSSLGCAAMHAAGAGVYSIKSNTFCLSVFVLFVLWSMLRAFVSVASSFWQKPALWVETNTPCMTESDLLKRTLV